MRAVIVVVLWLAVSCASAGDQARIEAEVTSATDTPPACTPGTTASPSSTSSTDATHASPATSTSVETTSSSTTATTTAPTTTTTTTRPPDPELLAAQTELDALGYWLGPIDGLPGSMTAHAVTAFQKAEGLPRTGELDGATLDRLAVATRPQPRSDGTVLEIDLARQILLVASGGRVDHVFDIATGATATPTPTGRYEIYREIDGFRHAPLGTLYRPKYFNGGIALHGYTSVPSQPASHGCVRLTYAAMDFVWAEGLAPIGTTVSVY